MKRLTIAAALLCSPVPTLAQDDHTDLKQRCIAQADATLAITKQGLELMQRSATPGVFFGSAALRQPLLSDIWQVSRQLDDSIATMRATDCSAVPGFAGVFNSADALARLLHENITRLIHMSNEPAKAPFK